MAVYKRGNVYWYKFVWNGELIQKSTKLRNMREAEKIEAAKRTALAKGEVGIKEKPTSPTLADFAPKFTAAIETTCAEKPATITFYKAKLKPLVKHLGDLRLDEIEEGPIEQYTQMRAKVKSRRKRALSPASVNRELATLRRLLRLAHEWKMLDRVPRIHLLRGEQQREFTLNRQQETLYLDSAQGDLRDVAALLIDTGLRIRECLTLEWGDVRLDPAEGAQHGYLTVRRKNSKNSKSRNVPLTARVVDVLKRRNPAARGLVFHRARRGAAIPDLAESAARGPAHTPEDAGRLRAAFLPAHLWNAIRRDGRRRIYYHEADGPQHSDGLAAVRASFPRSDGASGLADGGVQHRDAKGGYNFRYSGHRGFSCKVASGLDSMRPGGETGRRKGLKILFPATGVRVRFPPRAPLEKQLAGRGELVVETPAAVSFFAARQGHHH